MISDNVFLNTVMSADSLRDESKNSYMKQLRQVLKNTKDVYGQSQNKFYYLLTHPDIVMKAYKRMIDSSKVSLGTAKANIVALGMLIKRIKEFGMDLPELATNHKKWIQNIQSINNQVTQRTEKNQLSKRESDAWVSHDEWLRKEKELRANEIGSPAHLLVAFHSLLAPPRGGDLSAVLITKAKDVSLTNLKQNILVWDGVNNPSTLIIRSHKTDAKFPAIRQELPNELKISVQASLSKTPRQYLFESEGLPYKRGIFINWKNREFLRQFKKPTTTNTARHAYVNHKEATPASIETRRKEASSMGHSLQTHAEYRKIT